MIEIITHLRAPCVCGGDDGGDGESSRNPQRLQPRAGVPVLGTGLAQSPQPPAHTLPPPPSPEEREDIVSTLTFVEFDIE